MHNQDSTDQKQLVKLHIQNYFRLWLEDECKKIKAIIPYVKVEGLGVLGTQIDHCFQNIKEMLDLALLLAHMDISDFYKHQCTVAEAERTIRERYEWQRNWLMCVDKIDFHERRKILLKWLLSDLIT